MIVEVFFVLIIVGFVGFFLGIGGGFIVILFLLIVFKFNMYQAAAVGFVLVIVILFGAVFVYVKDRFIYFRIGMFLQFVIVIGGVFGVILSGFLLVKVLLFIFGIFFLYNLFLMIKNRKLVEKL